MAKFDHQIALLTLLLMIASSCINLSHCSKKPVGVARKEDIPYIKCQVCEKLSKELYRQVQAKEAQISPKKVTLLSGYISKLSILLILQLKRSIGIFYVQLYLLFFCFLLVIMYILKNLEIIYVLYLRPRSPSLETIAVVSKITVVYWPKMINLHHGLIKYSPIMCPTNVEYHTMCY